MAAAQLYVDLVAMSGLRTTLGELGAGFSGAVGPVRERMDEAVTGAGEFADALAEAAATFALSWAAALRAYEDSCRLLGSHVGAAGLQLQRLDRQLAGSQEDRLRR